MCCPMTFGRLSDDIDSEACRAALRIASTELEVSLLHGLPGGAIWKVERLHGR